MKDFFTIIKERRSIRKFKKNIIPIDDIEKIIDSARYAPSALNQQPWEFIVVMDVEKKKKIRKIYDSARARMSLYQQDTSFVENAAQIFVCAADDKVQKVLSSTLAIQNMLLSAEALDLGSIVMTAPVSTEESVAGIKTLLKIPGGYTLVALVLIGYKDEEPAEKEKRCLKEIMHVDVF